MAVLTSFLPSPETQVCVCGIGARTPLGFDAAASAAAVRGSISAVEANQDFLDKVGEPMNLARDPDFDPVLPLADRMEQMLASAIAQVPLDSQDPHLRSRLHCWIGLPEPRPGLPDRIGPSIADFVAGRSGVNSSAVHLMPFGHASGLMAMQAAAQAIAAREIECALIAGTDSYHDRATLDWLDQTGLLMSSENRNGFPPSEAAGACLLASADAARRYGLRTLGYVAGAATSFEQNSIRVHAVCTGEGLTTALSGASAALAPSERLTATYCDLNGERYRNEEFVYAMLRVQHAFVDAHDYACPADCWGDVGAASGLLFAVLALAASERGYATGSLPLLWAGSESGHRGAVILRLELGTDLEVDSD